MNKIQKFLLNSKYRFDVLTYHGFYKNLSDEEFLRKSFKINMKKELDLENPITFNEKIQWLKLYDRQDIYCQMVDKYEAKKYVADIIGEEYIIPTIGVWDKVEEIPFESLPHQFVLKCTHDCGGSIICKDKSSFDVAEAKKKLSRCIRRNYYWNGREWPYKSVRPRIICEQYMEDTETKELRDYKFFAFDGDVKFLYVASDRQNPNEETKFDFYDMDFNRLEVKNGHPNSKKVLERPQNFEIMCKLAEKLSEGYPLLRVDLYEVNGKVFFGELTLSHMSGMFPFEPEIWDRKFGEYIKLPVN